MRRLTPGARYNVRYSRRQHRQIMNAPAPASLLSRGRARASRPHPRGDRSLQRRHQPQQGQPRRRRLLRRERQGAAARVRAARRARARRDGGAPGLSADRRHARLRPGGAACCSSAREHPAVVEKRVVTVQTLGGTGGLKVGADFLRRVAPGAPRSGSAIRAGRTTARSSRARASRSTPIPTTTRRRAASISTRCCSPAARCRRARSSCCTRAATTRPASI